MARDGTVVRWRLAIWELARGAGNSALQRLEWQLRLMSLVAAMRGTALIGWFGGDPSIPRALRASSVLVSVAFIFVAWSSAARLRARSATVGAFEGDPEFVGGHLPLVTFRSSFCNPDDWTAPVRLSVLNLLVGLPAATAANDINRIVLWAISWTYVLGALAFDHRAVRAVYTLGPVRVRAFLRLISRPVEDPKSLIILPLELRCVEGVVLESARLVCLYRDGNGRLDRNSPRWTANLSQLSGSERIRGQVTLSRWQFDDVARRPDAVFYLDFVLTEQVAIGSPPSVERQRASYLVPVEW